MGSKIAKQDLIKPNIVTFYLFAICSLYIDHKYSLAFLEILQIKCLLQKGKAFFLATKVFCLLISKNILYIITS